MRIDVERDGGAIRMHTSNGTDGVVELHFEGLLRYRAEIGYGAEGRVRHSFYSGTDELDALVEINELDEVDDAA